VAVGSHHDRRRLALACHADDHLGDRRVDVFGHGQAVGLEAGVARHRAPCSASFWARSAIAWSTSTAVRTSIGAGGRPMLVAGSSTSSQPTPPF
jgi:hypothetical protein